MYIIYYWNVTRKHGSFLYNSKAKTSHERRCMKFRPTNLFRLGLKNGWRVFGVCPNSHSTGRSFHRVFPCRPDKKIDSDTHTHTHTHIYTSVLNVPEPIKTGAMHANGLIIIIIIIIIRLPVVHYYFT